MDESIGIYVHVPFCKHACPYCDFYKLELRERPARARLDFPGQVAAEWELLSGVYTELKERPVGTIYFGGGTPSTLVPEAVGALVDALKACRENVEVTLEANPENLTPGRCVKWRGAGVTRLSIGAQSFDAGELRLLERLHEPAVIAEAVRNARRSCIDNISLDLMFALPGQTMKVWIDNLRKAIDLKSNHISFYGLTFHEGTPFHDWLCRGKLEQVDDDLQAEMYIQGAELLESAGFEHYEISNFARPGYRSRHNQRYWTRADVIGLGPGAHSNLARERWANPDDIDLWSASIASGYAPRQPVERLGPSAAFGERLFTALRRCEGVCEASDADLFRAVSEWFADAPLEARDWVLTEPGRIRLNREGWLRSNAIIDSILR